MTPIRRRGRNGAARASREAPNAFPPHHPFAFTGHISSKMGLERVPELLAAPVVIGSRMQTVGYVPHKEMPSEYLGLGALPHSETSLIS